MSVTVECECGWTDRVPDAYYSELALALHDCYEPGAMGNDTCRGCAVGVPHSVCESGRSA